MIGLKLILDIFLKMWQLYIPEMGKTRKRDLLVMVVLFHLLSQKGMLVAITVTAILSLLFIIRQQVSKNIAEVKLFEENVQNN